MKETENQGTRINKMISDYGFCSRREADRLIADGRVTINNRPAIPGDRVGEEDKVRIDGEPLYFVPLENRPKKHRWGPPRGRVEDTEEQSTQRSGSRGAARRTGATRKTAANRPAQSSASRPTSPKKPAAARGSQRSKSTKRK